MSPELKPSNENNTVQNGDEISDSQDVTEQENEENDTLNEIVVIRRKKSSLNEGGKKSVQRNSQMENDKNSTNGEKMSSTATTPTISSPPHLRDRLQRKLFYFFMSPIDKWKAKRRFPIKLLLQIFKIILVTTSLIFFGYDMSRYLSHQGNIAMAFRQIFFEDYDSVREVMTYPPSVGPYAVYTKDEFYQNVDYAIQAFSNISLSAIGSFGYSTNTSIKNMSVILICRKFYVTGEVDPSSFSYMYNNKIDKECIEIDNIFPPSDVRWNNFSSLEYFNTHNFSLNFDRLLQLKITFPLRDIYLNSLDTYESPECYEVNVTITYDNTNHDGQMFISLNSMTERHSCHGNLDDNISTPSSSLLRRMLTWSTVGFCVLSTLVCLRSLRRAYKLRLQTEEFFFKYLGKTLSFSEKMEFLDLWIVMIIINDMMIIAGTIIKNYDSKGLETGLYDFCSILLGVGNLLVWAGLLRYLEFFPKYNVLILTVRKAVPNVLRFVVCALLLYGGFCFAGWVILGPYHLKFRTLSESSECLFSLINGDDMFATFYTVDAGDKILIWWFSRLFLYIFISLFIYIVLSLFIAIIMDAYETIKDHYENGWPLSDLQKFISECPDSSSSIYFRQDPDDSIVEQISSVFRNCFSQPDSYHNL